MVVFCYFAASRILFQKDILNIILLEKSVCPYTDACNQNRCLLRKPYLKRGTLSQDYIC